MAQVGRELEREQHVVQVQKGADVLAQRRVGRQFQQAAVVFAELQFARRAQHALAFHATQLAELDLERLAVLTRRQFGTDQGHRHADADAGVGRTANDVQQRAAAHVDLAHAQAVGIRVLLGVLDLANHDLAERRHGGMTVFDLQTGHGQGIGQGFAGQGRVAELAQPGFRKLHGLGFVVLSGTGSGSAGRRQRTGAGRSRHSAAWSGGPCPCRRRSR